MAELTYELSPGSLLPPLSRPARRAPLLPILAPPSAAAQGTTRYPTAEMHIKNNCGDDNICVPDLRLQLRTKPSEYHLGSRDPVNVMVGVRSAGEDAFQAKLSMQVPTGLSFIKFAIDSSTDLESDQICYANIKNDKETVR